MYILEFRGQHITTIELESTEGRSMVIIPVGFVNKSFYINWAAGKVVLNSIVVVM